MRIRLVAILATCMLFPAVGAAGPAGWNLTGTDRSAYTIVTDRTVTRAGKPSGRLMSIGESRGFGTMMQCIDPGDYAGKRVRFSGYVKAEDVRNWAGLWMRVDGPSEAGRAVEFDNMHERPIRGTRDWARYDVVLDVARDASGICLGILLDGDGKVWISDVTFEIVGPGVPTTGTTNHRPSKPANMGFAR